MMRNSCRILVVDDDTATLRTLKDILVEKGCQTQTATDGSAAITSIQERSYDVILTDIKMPGMSGVELLRQVKALSPSTHTIIMTAFTRDELVHRAQTEGAVEILFKPLDLDRLFALIDELRTIPSPKTDPSKRLPLWDGET
jgi:DNA-binding NtrC family response regulator